MDAIDVRLRTHASQEEVPAILRELDPGTDLKRWEDSWKPALRESAEEDRNWNWRDKYMDLNTVNYEYYAIECESATQGLMVIDTDFHRTRVGKQWMVYVNFLATAPWNRLALVKEPKFRRVGPLLLRHALVRSEELGYKFRAGLHSLPNSEQFYGDLGLTDYGPDSNLGNLRYFEFSEETGNAFVEG